jgi:flavin reductase ActVB
MLGPSDFRRVLGHFASGVTLVTTLDADARPAGLTASAFTSVSLDPPLVLVCVDHKAQCFSALLDAGRFAVNILTREQETLSRRFASTGLDKFDGVEYVVSERQLPVIAGALATLECTTVSAYPEGDHTILVGRVESGVVGSGEPLLYFRGHYDRLASSPA